MRCKIINYYYRGLIICIGRLDVFKKTRYRGCFRILDEILDTISFDCMESDGICIELGCIFDRANPLEAQTLTVLAVFCGLVSSTKPIAISSPLIPLSLSNEKVSSICFSNMISASIGLL